MTSREGMFHTLLTSVGRSNYLVEYFQEALRGRGRVFAADAKASSPALQEADGMLIVPPIGHKHYVDALLEFCQDESIDLLVPLNDLELPYLAAARERFAALGTTVVVSAPEVVHRCYDKWEAFEFLHAHGIPTPRTYATLEAAQRALERGEIKFPLVLKPRWGSASIGLEFPQDEDELELSFELSLRRLSRTVLAGMRGEDAHALLVQEFVVGDEYGLDIVNDLKGQHVTTFAKHKLGMRAGETDSAVTVADETLAALGRKIGQTLGHIGSLDCDVFIAESGPSVIELNPRFGGGYPFSHVAGANLPAALIAWARGEAPDANWLRLEPGVMSSKFGRLMLIR
jgi:carbamoyl-phosphate synthase large subunit